MALDAGDPRVIVATRDPRGERGADRAEPSNRSWPLRETTPAACVTPAVDPRRSVEGELCRLWSEALHRPLVRPDDNVFELGADSLIALQVVASIERQFGCELSPIVCYEAPTPRLLAQVVAGAGREGGTLVQSEGPVSSAGATDGR
jgi:acyl carrier protein